MAYKGCFIGIAQNTVQLFANNNEAEINILKARNKLEKFVKQASASEIKVNVIATIDHNVASGIARISREIMADVIVLGWPRRTGIFDKLIGEKLDGVLSNSDKTTFVCHLEKPLVMHKRILIAAPPLTEQENGFKQWFFKIMNLAQELSIPILFYCNSDSEVAVKKFVTKAKISASLTFQIFDNWNNFKIISRNIHEDDLFVLVTARKGAASFMGVLENLPTKLEKYFSANSRLLIYPQQFHKNYSGQRDDDITGESLNKEIEIIKKDFS